MYRLPLAYWTLGVQASRILTDAHTVIAFRMLGATGGWPVSPSEHTRMVTEKGPAFLRAYGDAAVAAMRGKRLDEIAGVAMKPIARKTRSNAKRLSRGRS